MKNVLVIYQIIPEDLKKVVVQMTEEEYEYFSKAEGYIINFTDFDEEQDEVVNVISNALCENPEYLEWCETQKQKDYFGKWVNKELNNSNIQGLDRVITCGFLM